MWLAGSFVHGCAWLPKIPTYSAALPCEEANFGVIVASDTTVGRWPANVFAELVAPLLNGPILR